MRLIRFFLSFVLFASLLLASDRHAWAYVDPGSGLFALQGFASITAALSYLFRRRVLALFRRTRAADPPADHDDRAA